MDDIFTYTSFTTSNCYILTPDIQEGISYVIDLPPDLDEVLNYINSNNLSVGGALLTHGHFDHSLGMSGFDGSIYIDLNDEHLARNPEEQLKGFTALNLSPSKFEGDLIHFSFVSLPLSGSCWPDRPPYREEGQILKYMPTLESELLPKLRSSGKNR